MLAHPQAARGLEQVLLQAMVACLRTDDVHEVKAGQRHHRKIMQRFHATLAADPDRPWYALEMAIAVGASLRSLSACCQEHLGMGPMRFLMLRRMQLARRELREADPGTTTVTDVATRYGFWQFGRFAGQYKLRFGESPSTTLYGRVGKVAEDHHGLGIASRSLTLAAGLIALALLSVGARAQTAMQGPAPTINVGDQDADSATALAKKLQNPIGDLYSFPFQNNANFNYGPHSGTQDILNVQPVIPIHINEDWNVITRTILPLIWQPSLQPAHTVPFGTGPTTFSAFLSPHNFTNGWLWGVGPVVQVPTISDKTLGSPVWGGGPTGVVVYMTGPIVSGVLVNNVWSFGGTSLPGGTKYNTFLMQPFLNYNFGEGWYVGSSPVITANWLSSGNNAWTLPVGANVGRVIKIGGKLPVNISLGAYYNALRPQYGSTLQLRTQLTLIF